MLKEINVEQALSILNHNMYQDIMFNIYSTPNGDGSRDSQSIKKYEVANSEEGIVLSETVDFKCPEVVIPISSELISILLTTMHGNIDLTFTYKTVYRQIKLVSAYQERTLKQQYYDMKAIAQ